MNKEFSTIDYNHVLIGIGPRGGHIVVDKQHQEDYGARHFISEEKCLEIARNICSKWVHPDMYKNALSDLDQLMMSAIARSKSDE